MCASFEGTMSRSAPTSACPVARIRRSPFVVSGSSVVPVCRPFRDHWVSPWRTIKARGVTILDDQTRRTWLLDDSGSFDLERNRQGCRRLPGFGGNPAMVVRLRRLSRSNCMYSYRGHRAGALRHDVRQKIGPSPIQTKLNEVQQRTDHVPAPQPKVVR